MIAILAYILSIVLSYVIGIIGGVVGGLFLIPIIGLAKKFPGPFKYTVPFLQGFCVGIATVLACKWVLSWFDMNINIILLAILVLISLSTNWSKIKKGNLYWEISMALGETIGFFIIGVAILKAVSDIVFFTAVVFGLPIIFCICRLKKRSFKERYQQYEEELKRWEQEKKWLNESVGSAPTIDHILHDMNRPKPPIPFDDSENEDFDFG